jgi:hypothetical protein
MMKPMEEMGLGKGCDLERRCVSEEKIGLKKKHFQRRRCVSKDGGDKAGEERFPEQKTCLRK